MKPNLWGKLLTCIEMRDDSAAKNVPQESFRFPVNNHITAKDGWYCGARFPTIWMRGGYPLLLVLNLSGTKTHSSELAISNNWGNVRRSSPWMTMSELNISYIRYTIEAFWWIWPGLECNCRPISYAKRLLDGQSTSHWGRTETGLQLGIWPDTGSCRRMVAITSTNLPLFRWTRSFWTFCGNARHVDVFCRVYVNYVSPITSVALAFVRLVYETDLPSRSALCRKLTRFIEMLNSVKSHFLYVHMFCSRPVSNFLPPVF